MAADEQPNPMFSHIMSLVEGRQQGELAKLSILTKIASSLEDIRDKLTKTNNLLIELNERTKG